MQKDEDMAQTAQAPVPASEFCRNFGRYKDEATANRVVEVSSNGRPIGAFLSQAEYQHYLTLRRREPEVFKIDELPSELIEEIKNAEFGVIAE